MEASEQQSKRLLKRLKCRVIGSKRSGHTPSAVETTILDRVRGKMIVIYDLVVLLINRFYNLCFGLWLS
jgi:hypothetical protein